MIRIKLKESKIQFDKITVVDYIEDKEDEEKVKREILSHQYPVQVLSEYYILRIENVNGVKTAYISKSI